MYLMFFATKPEIVKFCENNYGIRKRTALGTYKYLNLFLVPEKVEWASINSTYSTHYRRSDLEYVKTKLHKLNGGKDFGTPINN